jgi:hypothetical protein
MRTRRRATVSELRGVVDCLPRRTKIAMLEGIRSGEIIVGAYVGEGGICPMLAAHRRGGRTDMISFARAWDRFAFRGSRKRRARPATERELLVLRTHLEASLLEEKRPGSGLAAAVTEHQQLLARRGTEDRSSRTARGRASRDDVDRSRELRHRPGWAWLRIFRRYDDYEHALAQAERAAKAPERQPVA